MTEQPVFQSGLPFRIGIGFDMHQLVVGRRLILGGVDIPYELGLAGHSDGDVVVHAVIDALLGAAALGDIGQHFPSTEERYREISSLFLLTETQAMLIQAGWRLVNVDATVIAQLPRLAPYLPAMRRRLAETLGVEVARVSVKATTTDGLDAAGRSEGIAALAVAMIEWVGHPPARAVTE